ncbi:MAG: hypothetical protein NW224_12965 [Leptolyngbyaceae cyanobacterium bins.302]|nr:hypothetical protein [Leptolyngbyaceae cyanobacterium bins.302]
MTQQSDLLNDLLPIVVNTSPSKQSFTSQTLGMMRAIAQLEPVSPGFLSILLQLLEVKAAHLNYFRGPIIVGKSEWTNLDVIVKLRPAVMQERFLHILDEVEQGTLTETITPAEIVCALQPLTLVSPLSRDYADLCIWAFGEVLKRHPTLFGVEAAQSFAVDDYLIEFRRIESVYKDLSIQIRRKVMKLAPKGERSQQAKANPTDAVAVNELETDEMPQLVQQSLF